MCIGGWQQQSLPAFDFVPVRPQSMRARAMAQPKSGISVCVFE